MFNMDLWILLRGFKSDKNRAFTDLERLFATVNRHKFEGSPPGVVQAEAVRVPRLLQILREQEGDGHAQGEHSPGDPDRLSPLRKAGHQAR